jgi:hypothetical protein
MQVYLVLEITIEVLIPLLHIRGITGLICWLAAEFSRGFSQLL